MPSLITHYLCGNKWLNQLDQEAVKSLVMKYRQVFNVGTQGPDILFYYRIWPWYKTNGIDKIGSKMHSEKISEVFQEGLIYIQTTKENRDLLTAYFLGYASHYALDSNTHPYIYYMTGFAEEKGFKGQYSCYHSMFEKAIDIQMLEMEQKQCHTDIKVDSFIRLNSHEALTIGNMYSSILAKVFNISITPKQVATAITDMRNIYSFLEDKTGKKMKLFNWLEKKLNYNNYVTSNMYTHTLNKDFDYLNHQELPWQLPWDNTAVKNDSFFQLYNNAIDETNRLSQGILNYLEGNKSLEATMEIIGNKSFSTGVDCDAGIEMKYHNCIYEQQTK